MKKLLIPGGIMGWTALEGWSFSDRAAHRSKPKDTERGREQKHEDDKSNLFCIQINNAAPSGRRSPGLQPPAIHNPELYARNLLLPLAGDQRLIEYATCDTESTAARLCSLGAEKGTRLSFRYIPKAVLIRAIESRFGRHLAENAAWRLAWEDPQCSAHLGIIYIQRIILLLCLGLIAGCAVMVPAATLSVSLWVIGLVFAAMTAFRFVLLGAGLLGWRPIHYPTQNDEAEETTANGTESPVAGACADLPVYTILAPLYDEPEVVPQLIRAFSALDYPAECLDIKLLLEEDDKRTLAAIEALNLPPYIELLHVPNLAPRTKPKACNYGLAFARGAFTVIFDAEDIPDPDQLKRAVAKFAATGPETACLQARLNFYNPRDNWLTRQFTLEYSMWFDLLLPGLKRLGLPIPLGGTSNHFRTDILRAIGGWDPYNVTEDADLGLRLARRGYRCDILNSTTYEEANSETLNWLRQRTRWQKGYMLTWLVHMRHPLRLLRQLGMWRMLGFQLFFGGTVLLAICTPLAIPLLLSGLVLCLDPILSLLKFCTLIGGLGTLSLCVIAGAICRGNYDLIADIWCTPFYWLLTMAANIRAVWQLFQCPFYWEKTRHGLNLLRKSPMG